MKGEFEARITIKKVPLSRASKIALENLDRYDVAVFTSGNAERLLGRKVPPQVRVVRVGPRKDLLKFDFKGKRVLFPRSALAPFDIVRKLRAKGAIVRAVSLYTAEGVPLSRAEKKCLLNGSAKQLFFKSPSGIDGLLKQFSRRQQDALLSIPARCIGETTAKAARKAGFRKVFIR